MPEGQKQRIALWIGALFSVSLACYCWLAVTRKPAAGPTETQALQMGFSSAARYNEISALSHNATHLRDLSEAQFALIADVLQKDGIKPRISAIVAMNSLRTLEQQRRAAALMKPHVKEPGVSGIIYFVMQTYAHGDGRVVVEEIARDADANARALAATVLRNVPDTRGTAKSSVRSGSQGSS